MRSKQVKLSDEISSEGENVLHCPNCDGFYLHQEKTEVFERGEDSPTGLHVNIQDGAAKVDQIITGNPSPRRHGLTVHFNCETCDSAVQMVVYQHKGNTFVGMFYDLDAS